MTGEELTDIARSVHENIQNGNFSDAFQKMYDLSPSHAMFVCGMVMDYRHEFGTPDEVDQFRGLMLIKLVQDGV